MADFAFTKRQRREWEEAAGAAVVTASLAVRKKMAAALSARTSLPPDASAIFNTEWWESQLPQLADDFKPIAAQAVDQFDEATKTGISDEAKSIIAAGVAAGVAELFSGRGDVVYERVDTLIEQGEQSGMDAAGLSDALGLESEAVSGPLSEALMESMGTAAATSLAGGAVQQTVQESGMMGLKTWNCLFLNSRESHEAADGQTVAVDETFTLDGGEALYPCDPDLPVEEVANCNCWLTYSVVPAPAGEGGDSETVSEDDVEAEELAVADTPKVPSGIVRMTAQSAPWVAFADPPPLPPALPDDAVESPAVEPPMHTTGVITIEPTPQQKVALAIPGGEAPEALHVTLVYLGETTALGDAARMAVTGVLARLGAQHGPMSGKIGGIGWFQDANAMTLGLIDADGLAAFRTALVAELVGAGVAVDDTHDFIPHMTLAYSQVDAGDRVGTELTFNELRLRWNDEIIAFDLIGVPESPALPAVPSVESPPVVVPASQEAALATHYEIHVNHPDCAGSADGSVGVVDDTGRLISCHVDDVEAQQKADELNSQQVPLTPTDQQAPTPPTTSPVSAPAPAAGIKARVRDRRFDLDDDMLDDGMPGDDPEMVGPPADLSDAADDDLASELARRIAQRAIEAQGLDANDPAVVAAALAEAVHELNEAIEEVHEEVCDELMGGDDDVEDEDEDHGVDDVDWDDVASPVPNFYSNRGSLMTRRRAALVARATTQEASVPDDSNVLTLPPEADPTAPTLGDDAGEMEWEGVLTVEGLPSGDRRMIAEGSLTWRVLPIPLMLQTVNSAVGGHDGAVFCGWIHEVFRDGEAIFGRGTFLDDENGERARSILSDPKGAKRFGVSVDIDSVTVVYTDMAGTELSEEQLYSGEFDVVEMIVAGRLMGATMTPFPAFQEAQLTLLVGPVEGDEPALVASAGVLEVNGQVWRSQRPCELMLAGASTQKALVASAGGPDPLAPPRSYFGLESMDDGPVPFSVHAPDSNGIVRCYGLVAEFGSCHLGSGRGRCVDVPRNTDFRAFYTGKKILTREGEQLAVGPIIMDTVHPDLLMQASDAQAFYAHTGCAAADVRLYANEYGIVAAGVVRPDVSPTDVRRLRASDISPDWRPMKGSLRLVSLLAVNLSGFLVEGLVASAGRPAPYAAFSPDGEMTALVAAGAILRDRKDSLLDRVAAMEGELGEMKAMVARLSAPTRAAERRARAAAALDTLGLLPCETGDCAG